MSIGIIGGADGPTSIIVSSVTLGVDPFGIIANIMAAAAVVFAVLLVLRYIKRRKK